MDIKVDDVLFCRLVLGWCTWLTFGVRHPHMLSVDMCWCCVCVLSVVRPVRYLRNVLVSFEGLDAIMQHALRHPVCRLPNVLIAFCFLLLHCSTAFCILALPCCSLSCSRCLCVRACVCACAWFGGASCLCFGGGVLSFVFRIVIFWGDRVSGLPTRNAAVPDPFLN